jgi:hypothetical protein
MGRFVDEVAGLIVTGATVTAVSIHHKYLFGKTNAVELKGNGYDYYSSLTGRI